MATSSFSKTFVLNTEAVKTIRKQTAVRVPASANNRVKEGKEALTRFKCYRDTDVQDFLNNNR